MAIQIEFINAGSGDHAGMRLKTKATITGGLEFSPKPQGHQHDAMGDASVIPHGAKEERAWAPQRPSESVMIQRER